MKKYIYFLFFSFSLFCEISQKNIAEKAETILVNRRFVVFVPSFNNEKYCEENLRSIEEQDYENFRVIYVDDASTDETYLKVSNFIEKSKLKEKFNLIKNSKNKKNIANLYFVVNDLCEDDEIVVNLDGDDFFSHKKVLSDLNAYYQLDSVWMTWGSYVVWSTGELGCHAKPVEMSFLKSGIIRKRPYSYSHLKTFYAGLFKKIKKEDFFYNGDFIKFAPDLPTMLPLLELSRTHARFIPETLYIYNDQNSISESSFVKREEFHKFCEFIYNRPSYESLKSRDW